MTVGLDNQSPEMFGQTPWQTVGPFFHYGLPWKGGADLVGGSSLGARPDLTPAEHFLLAESGRRAPMEGRTIEIHGQVMDGQGVPLPDAMVEIWQADANGSYASEAQSGFSGFGRAATDDEGGFRFRTLMPGQTPGPGGPPQAPHIAIGVFGRGLIRRLVTRLYFEGHPGNADDAILGLIPPGRRQTLMACAANRTTWRFDVVLQGENETVFFDV